MQKSLVEEKLSLLIQESIKELNKESAAPDQGGQVVHLDIPKERQHGDLFTNVAMRLASSIKKRPMEIAERLAALLEARLNGSESKDLVRRIEVKPPGFINFWLSAPVFLQTLRSISREKGCFGTSTAGKGSRVLLEYVSANPTGPLTIAHGRQAAFGDSLARILTFCGYKVVTEYYINDEGVQMSILADSVYARYLERLNKEFAFPENGYKGAYIYDIADRIIKKYGGKFINFDEHKRKAFFLKFSCENIMAGIRQDLKDFDVGFKLWYSQAKLARSGQIEDVLNVLRASGHVFENEGASWLKSTKYGDDKDRVVIKSDGSYTYLAPDIAYHKDKFERGFNKLIDIWGPDHHGYIPRMKAAIQALGFGKESLSVIILQLSSLFRDGKPVSMSTRQGEFITLRELMQEVGKNSGRFFFVMRRADSHLDFDLELAKKQSQQNPVYYVQYAHARICSILQKKRAGSLSVEQISALKEKEEMDLVRVLWQFPEIVKACGQGLEPHGLTVYLQEVSKTFHSFYDKHRVIGDDARQTKARLFLVNATRIVLANGLGLLGVTPLKKM